MPIFFKTNYLAKIIPLWYNYIGDINEGQS